MIIDGIKYNCRNSGHEIFLPKMYLKGFVKVSDDYNSRGVVIY